MSKTDVTGFSFDTGEFNVEFKRNTDKSMRVLITDEQGEVRADITSSYTRNRYNRNKKLSHETRQRNGKRYSF
jgi:hypothetical protein